MSDVDQRAFDNQRGGIDDPPRTHLGASEAAALLGIKRQTLYAYASRGLVQSVADEGGRGRRYLRADLERLRARHEARSGHGPVAASALRWGEPVLASSITEITPQGPRHRGHLATGLAASGHAFESVAELLWTGRLPASPAVRWPEVDVGLPPALLRALVPPGTPPPGALSAVVAALAVRDLDRFGLPAEVEWSRARALIRRMAACLALGRDPRALGPALAQHTLAGTLALALGISASRKNLALIDQTLVLCADHELNPSTFTARVAASSGADLHACISAALATHSGPRHGGACDRVEALVAEVGGPENALRILRERLQRGQAIDGFGHPLYPEGDPRAPPLLAAARAHAPRSPAVRTLGAIVEVMADWGQRPALDVGVVASALALGLPPGRAVGLFALGRSAGWVAHVLEQRAGGFLVRPRARFVPV